MIYEHPTRKKTHTHNIFIQPLWLSFLINYSRYMYVYKKKHIVYENNRDLKLHFYVTEKKSHTIVYIDWWAAKKFTLITDYMSFSSDLALI